MRRVSCALVVVAGCWSDAPLVDGTLTETQLAQLRVEMKLPDVDACRGIPVGADCDGVARLGQDLFFEPALSVTGTVACVTCHDPKGWFVDTRTPNNLSFGVTKWTGRNSPATLDLGLICQLAPGEKQVFTWSGAYASPGAVLELAITKPMGSPKAVVENLIANNSYYLDEYRNAFGHAPGTEGAVFDEAELAIGAYLARVSTGFSAFDNYIAGDDSALNDSAKRGFGVFVGRGTCIECHRGPALTDFQFHVTGVPQSGANVPASDNGRGDVTKDPLDNGAFRTPSLRNVARTRPYMHDGALSSLDDVIDFYRHGGKDSNYTGTKDPRIQPLDITDQDAEDLSAFLQSLNGMLISAELTSDLRPFKKLCGDEQVCTGRCVDTQTDIINCGGCGIECSAGLVCAMGSCVAPPPPPPICPMGTAPCGPMGVCMDVMTDPMNCGACGNRCATSYCMAGSCS